MEEDLEPIVRHRLLAHANKLLDKIDALEADPKNPVGAGLPFLVSISEILKNLTPTTTNISTIGADTLESFEGHRVAVLAHPRPEADQNLLRSFMPPGVVVVDTDDIDALGGPAFPDIDILLIEEGISGAAMGMAKTCLSPGGKILTLAKFELPKR